MVDMRHNAEVAVSFDWNRGNSSFKLCGRRFRGISPVFEEREGVCSRGSRDLEEWPAGLVTSNVDAKKTLSSPGPSCLPRQAHLIDCRAAPDCIGYTKVWKQEDSHGQSIWWRVMDVGY